MITLHCTDWNTHELCKMEGCTCSCHLTRQLKFRFMAILHCCHLTRQLKFRFMAILHCCQITVFCYDPIAAFIEHLQARHPLAYLDFEKQYRAVCAGGQPN